MKIIPFIFALVSVLPCHLKAQNIGIGTNTPFYKFQVTDGPLALYNTVDLKAWYFAYTSGSNYFYLAEDGSIRLTVANGGNVGIGLSFPTSKLDVNGDANVRGDAVVAGDVTVKNGKGIMYNVAGSTPLKYYTRTAAFTAILNGNQLSGEGSVGFSSAGFTSPPQVFAGDIVSTGGTVGELFRVQLVIYDVTTTSCHVRLLNTSPNAVNYNITWNMICIGN